MESLFEDSLIEEFTEFQNSNDFFTWHSFVNMKADIDTALGFAKFFCPDIIIVDECLQKGTVINQYEQFGSMA